MSSKLTEKTKKYRKNLPTNNQRVERIKSQINRFSELNSELDRVKKEYCLNNGYTVVQLSETGEEYLAPSKMSRNQFESIVQNISNKIPDDNRLYYLVEPDVVQEACDTDEYNGIVHERREIIKSVQEDLQKYIENNISHLEDEEKIVALYSVFQIEFGPAFLNEVIDCSDSTIFKYSLDNCEIVVRES